MSSKLTKVSGLLAVSSLALMVASSAQARPVTDSDLARQAGALDLEPVIGRRFEGLEQIRLAYAALQAARHFGKCVLTLANPED